MEKLPNVKVKVRVLYWYCTWHAQQILSRKLVFRSFHPYMKQIFLPVLFFDPAIIEARQGRKTTYCNKLLHKVFCTPAHYLDIKPECGKELMLIVGPILTRKDHYWDTSAARLNLVHSVFTFKAASTITGGNKKLPK